MKETKQVIKQVKKEVVTKVICDTCKKEAKGSYFELYMVSKYPEYDGDIYQFCSRDCLMEHLKDMSVYDLTYISSFSLNDIEEV